MSIKAHRKRQYSIIIDVFSVMPTFSVNEQDTDALQDFFRYFTNDHPLYQRKGETENHNIIT